jgi:hypothetical protein
MARATLGGMIPPPALLMTAEQRRVTFGDGELEPAPDDMHDRAPATNVGWFAGAPVYVDGDVSDLTTP